MSFDGMDSEDLYSELEDSLSDLEEGIDVLMILENAYERAIKAHVVNSVPEHPVSTAPVVSNRIPARPPSKPSPRPLKAGSSTALLAVLEQPAGRPANARAKRSSSSPPNHRSRSASRCRSEPAEEPVTTTAGMGPVPPTSTSIPRTLPHQRDAVIKIANLGDSMAMLVRGRDIVWRSEEMWWSFNTPVQLGPMSPSKPTDAQVFEIPVVADDVLILASDGLSDNLWDEEVLEEVVRVKDILLKSSASGGASLGQLLARRSLAGMLSEALCSRARRVAERGSSGSGRRGVLEVVGEEVDEVPFARRAREEGKRFKGGKVDGKLLSRILRPCVRSCRRIHSRHQRVGCCRLARDRFFGTPRPIASPCSYSSNAVRGPWFPGSTPLQFLLSDASAPTPSLILRVTLCYGDRLFYS